MTSSERDLMGFEMNSPVSRGISRRTALRTLGIGATTGVVVASGLLTGSTAWSVPPAQPIAGGVTVNGWRATRGSSYYIAHRGSGDVYPEHSMEAYQAAYAWGAPCLEISVGMTSDGVLICMHDATYDRTTNLTGRVNDQPSSVLADGRIVLPRLGEYWTRNAPRIPLFEDVLRTFGNRVVLAIEAKTDKAFVPIMNLLRQYGLNDSVIVKSHFSSRRWPAAQLSGFPVFCYFGAPAETTIASIADVGARLDPVRDCLVIPSYGGAGPYIGDDIVQAAVATGVPVWVYPLHRRSDAAHFFGLGVQGAVCSNYGYIVGAVAPVSSAGWATQAIEPGEMSKDPASNSYAPKLTATGELVLDAKGTQHFVTLGNMGPIPEATAEYAIDVDASWRSMPASRADNLTIAFARTDDVYYQHRQGRGDGYHAILRANGELGLYRHRDGAAAGQQLGASVSTPALAVGKVAHLRVDVSPSRIAVTRTDSGNTISVADTDLRGGYFHLGRSSNDGVAAFGNLVVS